MCGIAGFNIADDDARQIDSRRLAKMLLLEIQARGRHATGAAWSQRDPDTGKMNVWYAKQPGPATEFMATANSIPRGCRNAVLHTRYATQGSPRNNMNNHPIAVPGVVGVHNGHISNDDEIIDAYGGERDGEVDSEAAFRLIAGADDVTAELPRLQGRVALGWINVTAPRTLHLARLTGSPLAIGQTPGGSTVFASTEQLLSTACRLARVTLDLVTEVDEMTYLRMNNGVIHEWRPLSRVATPVEKQGMLFA